LKASKPEVVVETEDEMEFVIEEETVSVRIMIRYVID
jgi:hypothetical protein